jgi:uncharacterized coiled-coil protein SlyX
MTTTPDDLIRDELLTASQQAIEAIGAMLAAKEREIERLKDQNRRSLNTLKLVRASLPHTDTMRRLRDDLGRFIEVSESNNAEAQEAEGRR